MTLPQALRQALNRVRDQHVVYIEGYSARYRFMPDADDQRGYTLRRSIRYNDEWMPWIETEHFTVDDILYAKWRLV